MPPLQLLALLAQYGPGAIDVVLKIMDDIKQARTQTTVTADDLTELKRLSNLTGAGIYARLGITMPGAPSQA